MAEVTVKQLANDVGAPVERLLRQIVEAGLKARSENDAVSSDEKQQLLTYLRKNHGDDDSEPQKITLKRKTTTTLKAGGGARSKTVNVEVRKRRTYVKRAETQSDSERPEEAAELENEAQAAAPESPVVETPEVAASQPEAEQAEAKPETGSQEASAAPVEPEIDVNDIPAPPPDPESAKEQRKPKKKKEN